MKTVAIILVIFLVQCAYLRAEPKPGLRENVGDMIHSNSCVFGAKSISTYLYNSNTNGENVTSETVCNDPTQFDSTQKIAFVTHGFVSSPDADSFKDLISVLVQDGYSVLATDWSQGACTNGIPLVKFAAYPSAVQNTREVGDFLGSIIGNITTKCGVPLKRITLIGHSLGAHVSGFAAKYIKKNLNDTIPLLIAADPADPLFGFNKCKDRLCITDASYLVTLHTSILGIPYDMGHLDLQCNNGKKQPGCNVLDVSCSHTKSVDYITFLLKGDCVFLGVPIKHTRLSRKPSYPSSNTTDCIVVNNKIFDSDNIIEGRYYVFVEDPECTNKIFNCEQQ